MRQRKRRYQFHPRWGAIAYKTTKLRGAGVRPVAAAATGGGWLHEIKYDGYRMQARIDGGQVKLLTRTGLD
ncbi:MAG: hypothetical protein GEV13_18680 [Rhodospirillales bacterium]|nr:hypothetical protein [Rhodospirillales bacterium]